MFDTYLDKEHPEFDRDEPVCANCGKPIPLRDEDGRLHKDNKSWIPVKLCADCWSIHKAKTKYCADYSACETDCPFPWMGDRCSLNERGACNGAWARNPTYRAWEGLKWWVTDYERCLQDHQAITRLTEDEGDES